MFDGVRIILAFANGRSPVSDDTINWIILAVLLLFLAFVVPAEFRMTDDAASNAGVEAPFRAHGVRLP